MPDGPVGFSFQGDVITGGSLLISASGRLLKALSDGGVDIYAVGAVIWLGKTMPMNIQHESSIHKTLASRGSRTAFLNRALSIGWGHSDIAVEMARTRAGTAALLTIGALATGDGYYDAAGALSNLLLLSGCETDQLPNIDSLKTMVAYIAPIMADTGFSKVFEHIITTVIRQGRDGSIPATLKCRGELGSWVGALRQLILTAEREEYIYIVARQRGAWLAAYASHVLGMAVKLLCRTEVQWECAGDHGSVIIELNGDHDESLLAKANESLTIIDVPVTQEAWSEVPLSCLLSEVLDLDLLEIFASKDPRCVSHSLQSTRHEAGKMIATLCFHLKDKITLIHQRGSLCINAGFERSTIALMEVLDDLGISQKAIRAGLDRKHEGHYEFDEIQPDGVGDLVYRVSSMALALMQCVYDRKTLRIYRFEKPWRLEWLDFREGLKDKHTHISLLFAYISRLIHANHGFDNSLAGGFPWLSSTLAVSAWNSTLYYRAVFDAEAFDAEGRLFRISPGRVSSGGILRNVVMQHDSFPVTNWVAPSGTITKLHQGYRIEPHCSLSDDELVMSIGVTENSFVLTIGLGRKGDIGESMVVVFPDCIRDLSSWTIPPPCHHNSADSLVVRGQDEFHIATLGYRDTPTTPGIVLYALKGHRIGQLIQCAILGRLHSVRPPYDDFRPPVSSVLQLGSCLSCSAKVKQRDGGQVTHIIMAS